MFTKIRRNILSIVTALTLVAVPIAVPAIASATIQSCLSQGTNVDNPQLDQTANGADCTGASNTGSASQHINDLIRTIINVFSLIVGVVAVIMIIFGGFRYITSGGDSGNVSSAKNTIIYAIIGLVVVALAQFIVQFVLNKVTGQ